METFDEAQGERSLVCQVGAVRNVWIQSMRVRLPLRLLRRELFLDLSEAVIPECIYPISSNIPKPMKYMLATLCSKPAALIASSSRVIQSSGEPVDGVALIVQKLNI